MAADKITWPDKTTGDPFSAAEATSVKTAINEHADELDAVTGLIATAKSEAISISEAYADTLVIGLWDDRGNFDASVNAYPSTGGSGVAGAILKGDIWTVSVIGTLPTGQVVELGDTVRALINTPGNTQANWSIQQNNIGYVPENKLNKQVDLASSNPEHYPNVTAVNTGLEVKKDKAVPITTSTTALASNDSDYTVTAPTTFTDPTPIAGKGYDVELLGGTATIGGITYTTAGTLVKRKYNGSTWSNNVYRKDSLGTITPVNTTVTAGMTRDQGFGAVQGQITANRVDTTQFGFSSFFEKEDGMYYPVINSNMLDGTTGLANHASGGVVAAVAGVEGSGTITMPKPIDPTKPWTFAVLIELNDSQTINSIQFSNDALDTSLGMKVTNASTAFISSQFCGNSTFSQYGFTGGIPAGTKVWFVMASDGSQFVVNSLIPDDYSRVTIDLPSGGAQPSFQAAWDNNVYCKSQPTTYQNGSKNCFGSASPDSQYQYSLTKLQIKTQSTTNRIIGVWCNQSLGGPKDGQLSPPAIVRPLILQDTSAWVLLPGTRGVAQSDIVVCFHPNGNAGAFSLTGSGGNAVEMAKMHKQGFIVIGMTGTYNQSDIAGATSSYWGAPTGALYQKTFIEWVRANVPGTRYLFGFGQSMGGLNLARFAIEFPNQLRGCYLISPAVDLLDSINNRGFLSIVQAAFGSWYLCANAITGLNPGISVNITPAKNIGDTSLGCTALTSQIPAGTTLTLYSGTGQATVVTTALANAGATSISVVALTVAINNNAKYDASYHFTKVNLGTSRVNKVYYSAPYVWKNMYVQATAYVANDIVAIPSLLTANSFRSVDPTLTSSALKAVKFKIRHGDSDVLIPAAQSTAFAAALVSAGGTCTVVSVVGGTHLSSDMYNGQDTVDFFNSLI